MDNDDFDELAEKSIKNKLIYDQIVRDNVSSVRTELTKEHNKKQRIKNKVKPRDVNIAECNV